MEKDKKIIVGVVGFVLTMLLVFFFYGTIFSKESGDDRMVNELTFDAPELDLKKLDNSSKKELYDENEHEYDRDRYDSMADNLSFLQKMKNKLKPDTNEFDKEAYNELAEEQEEIDEINAQMQMLMDMQDASNTVVPDYGNAAPIQKVVAAKKEEPVKEIPQEGSYFFGAASSNKTSNTNLIPAEVIDQGFQKKGTTIAIRTKQEIAIPASGIKIPKNAVIYGVVDFDETRLMIKINSYKRDNKLYKIDIDVHDYDGQMGIHLNTRTIFKIPSNVTKDVYKAAIQRYSQQQGAFGGGNNDITAKDVRNVAALSAAKEISKELFDRRRVFIPRKYHLWLTVNQN